MGESTARQPNFYQALGHIIKVMRTDLGIDRKDLAERTGISYSYLAAIENGRKQPSSSVLLSLAEALGLRTHQLVESAEERLDHQRATTTYPAWLAEGPPPAPAAVAPASEASPAPPRRKTIAESGGARSDFLGTIERLDRDLDDSDRELLIDMAQRLASRGE